MNKKIIITLLLGTCPSLFASAESPTSIIKKTIATATLKDDKNYSIRLANGFVFEIRDNKQVAPAPSGWSDGRCYQKAANPNPHLGYAQRLLWGQVNPAANALLKPKDKKAAAEQPNTTHWNVFEDESVEQVHL